MPSAGICARCVERGENTPEHAAKIKATQPSLSKQAATFGKALVNWTASGLHATPQESLDFRIATCRACPEWDATGYAGSGKCRKCGCSTWPKLRMASESCPLGKWDAVTPSVASVTSVVNPLPPAP